MSDRSSGSEWRTALTRVSPNRIEIRGVDVSELMRAASFAEVVYLLLKGERPSPAHTRLMNAILVSSIDHGVTPPSVLSTRAVVSGGNALNAAVAAGVLAIGDSHGGAIEACARLLQEKAPTKAADTAAVAERVVAEYQSRGERIPGFGHRLHTDDPRTRVLFEMADREKVSGRYVAFGRALESALEKECGRKLPINVDGAIAALISEMGFDWRLGKGFFVIARTPGLVAHAFEEWMREKPMREMTSFKTIYDGPEEG